MRTFNIEQTESQCVVTWRHVSFLAFKRLMFFVVGCPIFCLFAIVSAMDGGIAEFLFALLIGGMSFWVLVLVIDGLFGKTRLVLNENGLESTWTCLSLKRKKQIDLTKIRRFEKIIHYGKWGRWHCQFRVLCNGLNTNFIAPAGRLTSASKELDDVCEQLNAFLKTLKEPQV